MRRSLSLPLRLAILVAGTESAADRICRGHRLPALQAGPARRLRRRAQNTRSIQLVLDREMQGIVPGLWRLRVSRRMKRGGFRKLAAACASWDEDFPTIQRRVVIGKTLMDKELGSKLTYFEIFQLPVEREEDLAKFRRAVDVRRRRLRLQFGDREARRAEYRHTLSGARQAEQKASGPPRTVRGKKPR